MAFKLSILIIVALALCNASAFLVSPPAGRSFVNTSKPTTGTALYSEKQQMNPLAGIAEFFDNFDSMIDDFMDKKMGNGEVFYGKRKYSPSGKSFLIN